ncbi:hypothetical protein NC653_024546 [Populus alba x Populus x berolinensis]|uniref:Radical SAM core domain-containing protein n=1 Tax=Populus alba x Populus x berolinensis TaxID=444605 RepID=A0AAD6M931_9ROSI|nr:hypothetical protein NC653_024546 [Populus alba x Populus x berolinensis]
MEMSCLWTRRLLLGANSVLLVKHPAIAFSTLAATRSIQPSPLISLFPSSRRSLSTTTAACSPPLHPHSDIGNGAVNAAVAAAIPLESPKMLLKGMSYTELEKWVQSYGFRPGQAMMLWKRLNLQILFRLDDGLVIETVVIPCDRGRTTVCVSSQVGCAMNCQFCFTGRQANIFHIETLMGLKRHLSTAEIVEQAVFAQRLLTHEVGSFTNVVFMGMGEPLQNIDSVIKAADIMVHDQGLHFSPRKVTVSTSGLVPQLKRFLHESNCALAVSLNATTDEVRNWIMPINRKYNLGLLLQTLREELGLKNSYKVLFEYVMLDGVNDSVDDAYRLIDLVQGIPCKINLIQFNPHCGSLFRPTSTEKMIKFRNILAEAKCVVFMRYSKGDDQMAACGQLGKPGAIQTPLIRVPEQFKMAVNA